MIPPSKRLSVSSLVSMKLAVLWSHRQRLFAALGQITEVIVVGLHELPDDWHREHHNKPNGGPNCNGVVAH